MANQRAARGKTAAINMIKTSESDIGGYLNPKPLGPSISMGRVSWLKSKSAWQAGIASGLNTLFIVRTIQ